MCPIFCRHNYFMEATYRWVLNGILAVFIRMRNSNESNDQLNSLQASFRAAEDEVPRVSNDSYYSVPFRHLLWKIGNHGINGKGT